MKQKLNFSNRSIDFLEAPSEDLQLIYDLYDWASAAPGDCCTRIGVPTTVRVNSVHVPMRSDQCPPSSLRGLVVLATEVFELQRYIAGRPCDGAWIRRV